VRKHKLRRIVFNVKNIQRQELLEVEPGSSRPDNVYEIRLKEKLDLSWSDWFDGLNLSQTEDDGTLLNGPVADQPALHGVLAKIRDLNLTIIAIIKKEEV